MLSMIIFKQTFQIDWFDRAHFQQIITAMIVAIVWFALSHRALEVYYR